MGKVHLNEHDTYQVTCLFEQVASCEMSKDALRVLGSALLLSSIDDITREGLKDTPERVAGLYKEVFAGYEQSADQILGTTFEEENHHELVLVRDIPFYSHCEHHVVPFFGKAHVAYIPNGKVVGISKLARLVDCYAKRLQIQERLTSCVADDIDRVLSPMGVAVVIQAEHLCMSMRGVEKPGTSTVTSAVRGVFAEQGNPARMELMNLIKL